MYRARAIVFLSIAAHSLWSMGCASEYQLSSGASHLRAQLNDERATQVIAEQLQPQPGRSLGAYRAAIPNSLSAIPETVRIINDRLEFTMVGPSISATARPPQGCVRPSQALEAVGAYVRTTCWYSILLRQVRRIRVVEEAGAPADSDDLNPMLPGYSVTFGEWLSLSLVIHVAAADLDRLVAALSYFSPAAELVSGMGFK